MMTNFEMEGFLQGKCIPGDMKVNETNAEYLVRKLSMVDKKLEALDHLAGQFLQASVDRGGRVSAAYAECADLLAKTIRKMRNQS